MTTNQLGNPNSYLGNINLGGLVNMPAIIHFTQAPRDGGTGQSAIGFVAGQAVTMIDDGGPGADSYLWELLNWPAPLAVAPAITNATSQIATITPPMDGAYLVKLTRTEGIITTTDVRFFAVADADGLSLPTAGITGRMANIGASPLLAQAAGWMGSAAAGTNVMLDAYLRWLKSDLLALPHSEAIPGVSGLQSTQLDVFSRIGTFRVDPSKYPASAEIKFWAFLEATAAKTAECKLVNLTDGGEVAGSLLTGDQQVATYYEAVITLPQAAKDYEVQLRMTPAMVQNTEVAACSSAGLKVVWR